jgi:DNA invertase Pin-like site-specific DNA recombinase
MSEKIKPLHLGRKAILYIRQSSQHQVLHNEESRRLQYSMDRRLHELGWQEVEVIDEDLGRTASGTVTRAGFERMVAEVCLGEVGVVAAREVSRFARNSREWQQLVEVCRVVDTLLLDQETVYDPRQGNDRLLLGLKGSLNEYELDLLRQRSVEARYAKARRGELVVSAPVGFLKTEDDRLEKDPDRRVQESIGLVFRKFMELGSVRQTLFWFLEHNLDFPVRTGQGELIWKRPRYSSLYRILTHPVYAGAYAYGRTEHARRYEGGQLRRAVRRRPRDQWLALIPDRHEGYVSWQQFEQIQGNINENQRGGTRLGAPKQGAALLAGLLRCRRCGRRLMVAYTGRGRGFLRYTCCRGSLDNGEPRCIAFGGIPVDEAISRQICIVVGPGALEAAVLAGAQDSAKQDEILSALQRDLEAARYAANRAQKQYDTTDPENRLVADELERRWNKALERVHELEVRLEQHVAQQERTPAGTLAEFDGLARDLEAVWNDPQSDARLKKRIVRTLIHEVVAEIDPAAGEVILVIHWKGDVHTELRVPRRRRGHCSPTPGQVIDVVRILVHTCSDDQIAGALNRNGLRTGRGNRWTRERVTSLRSHHKIPLDREEQSAPKTWMNLTDAAKCLGVSAVTLRLAVERGEIRGEHPLADGPWVFNRKDLESEGAENVVARVKNRSGKAVLPAAEQRVLDFSST